MGGRNLANKRSAISLHDQPPMAPYTDEPSDEPPAYTDDDPSEVNQSQSGLPTGRLVFDAYPDMPGGRLVDTLSRKESYIVTLDPDLSRDPELLYKQLMPHAMLAPTVEISVKGTHSVKERDANNKKTSSTVTDFDFLIETRGTILPVESYSVTRRPHFDDQFRLLDVRKDDDGVSAYRGGRFKCKSTNRFKLQANDEDDPEQAPLMPRYDPVINPEKAQQALKEWCRRFAEDKSSVKSFTLRNKVVNLNLDLLRQEITSVIRATNYRGDITVSQITKHTGVTVYSPHILNKLRSNRFVWWAVVILQLWIIAWPILIFLEKRYEPVTAEHYVCRGTYCPPFLGEDEWTKIFAPAISAAAVGRRKNGELVTVNDIERARNSSGVEGERFEDSPLGRIGGIRLNTGNGSLMDTMFGLARGVSQLANGNDQSRGWGQHE